MIGNNIGAYITGQNAFDAQVVTAGAGIDGAATDGNVIDRLAAGKTLYQSGKVIIPFKAVLAEAATLSFTVSFKHGATNNPQAAYTYGPEGTPAVGPTVVATGPAGGGTVRGTFEVPVDLRMALRYFRVVITPDLSAANTDTNAMSAVLVEGGSDEKPAT